MNKVISWCLYVHEYNVRRLPEYLVGLRCNQRGARWWFPGWKLRLYVDGSLESNSDVGEFVKHVALYGEPKIDIFQCREGINPMVERYLPCLDEQVDVCLTRDVDSILSKTDADIVSEWLDNDDSDVLRYREYEMTCDLTMGGGVGVKNRALRGKNVAPPNTTKMGRGHDEYVLAKLLKHIPSERQTEILTRMTEDGVCINSLFSFISFISFISIIKLTLLYRYIVFITSFLHQNQPCYGIYPSLIMMMATQTPRIGFIKRIVKNSFGGATNLKFVENTLGLTTHIIETQSAGTRLGFGNKHTIYFVNNVKIHFILPIDISFFSLPWAPLTLAWV
jgi:hypothetical protein